LRLKIFTGLSLASRSAQGLISDLCERNERNATGNLEPGAF
jgi:hypothetical protein